MAYILMQKMSVIVGSGSPLMVLHSVPSADGMRNDFASGNATLDLIVGICPSHSLSSQGDVFNACIAITEIRDWINDILL